MQTKLFILISFLLLLGCSSNKRSAVLIDNNEPTKIVVVEDSIVIEFDSQISNSQIMEETKFIFDSIIVDNQLSAEEILRLNALDSVSFRRITKIINGGYNGWDYRWKLYNNAKKALDSYPDSIFKQQRP